MADVDALLGLAIELARQAGRLLVAEAPDRADDVSTKSSRTDMVTAVDLASEALIVGAIERERPDDGVLGEEGTNREGTSGVRWIIDPLDGTTNYLYGFPMFAVSIAVEIDGRVEAGAVFHPSLGELFTARRGDGARCNGQPIKVSGHDDLATALDLCWVACGRLDGFYEAGLAPWDFAAGDLIAREAGAETSDFDGGPIRPGAVLAASPAIAPALRLLVSEAATL